MGIKNIAHIVRYAGKDPVPELMNYIWQAYVRAPEIYADIDDPFELLHRAGYEYAEYADTLEKQNAIAPYFASQERLCTFNDLHRYKTHYIVNAVKHNAKRIKHGRKPSRQDKYATSVISIQIERETSRIFITNRYNDIVDNADATFDANPDNIIPGLTHALKKYFNISVTDTKIPDGYIFTPDCQFFKFDPLIRKFSQSIIGENAYIQNNKIIPINKNSQVLMDNFILDLCTHRLTELGQTPGIMPDAFINAFNTEIFDKKLTLSGRAPNQTILANGTPIVRLSNGRITWIHMPSVRVIGDWFMRCNTECAHIDLPNCISVGNYFATHNKMAQYVNMPKLYTADKMMLYSNTELNEFNMPQLMHLGTYSLFENKKLGRIYAPNIEKIEKYCFFCANPHELALGKLQHIGDRVLRRNTATTIMKNTISHSR